MVSGGVCAAAIGMQIVDADMARSRTKPTAIEVCFLFFPIGLNVFRLS